MDKKDSKNLDSIARSLASIDKSLKTIATTISPPVEEEPKPRITEEVLYGKPFRQG